MEGFTVFTYTRREAIDDGVLIDIPINKLAKEVGLKWHCAMTAGLASELSVGGAPDKGRIWDMLNIFRFMVLKKAGTVEHGQRLSFTFLKTPNRTQEVDVVFSVEDLTGNPEPCWTFMLPGED